MRHALPFLRQSDSASSLAFCTSERATIAQLDSEWAKAAHSVPKKLTSAGHSDASPQDIRALATAAFRVSCAQAIPHLLLAAE